MRLRTNFKLCVGDILYDQLYKNMGIIVHNRVNWIVRCGVEGVIILKLSQTMRREILDHACMGYTDD